MLINLLKSLGFSDKVSTLYLALLRSGPSSVRKLAEISGLNRGVVYDGLKSLQEEGVVEFYEKENKQYFVATNPEKLEEVAHGREKELQKTRQQIKDALPELKSLYNKGGGQPVARYFDGSQINLILEDVLSTCVVSGELTYRIYSAVGIREYLYDTFPSFSDARIAKGIAVKVIALGKGGELRGLDERKWIEAPAGTPTYIIIYPGKTAYISLNAHKEPIGVVIENEGVSSTQQSIFDRLWNTL